MLDKSNPTHPDEIQANETKLQFLNELSNNWNVYLACKKLGISRTLVYNEWLQKDKDFASRYNDIRESIVDGIEGNIISEALHNEKAITAQIFTLKNLRPEIWGEKQEINVNHLLNVNINEKALDTLKEMKAIQDVKYEVIEDKPNNINTLDTPNVEDKISNE